MSAADRLQRILYVLPAAARVEGVALADLARALEVSEQTILRDLGEAADRAFYHPAGTVDPFEIMIEGGRVWVHAPNEFNRPVRLSEHETLALGLGLRVLAAEAEADERAHILELAARLEDELATPRVEIHTTVREAYVPYERSVDVVVGEDSLRSLFADAIEQHRVCSIEYMKPQEGPAERRVLPQRLMYGNGRWYVGAHDVEQNQPRVFRLDRVLSAYDTGEVLHDVPATEATALYNAPADVEAKVRYSGTIARWIAEDSGLSCEADGSVVVTHRVADPNWLIRHVLQYGGEATVEAGPLRDAVAAAARALSA